ncbi:hypothetical protein [Burkholderia alba]|uniref:hypothetical protein n=1 Tax=Burkholderia alba TaxID=2683677 RepID=UPI002B05E335|nr:hypothetical protein [Burkholderia alba]
MNMLTGFDIAGLFVVLISIGLVLRDRTKLGVIAGFVGLPFIMTVRAISDGALSLSSGSLILVAIGAVAAVVLYWLASHRANGLIALMTKK